MSDPNPCKPSARIRNPSQLSAGAQIARLVRLIWGNGSTGRRSPDAAKIRTELLSEYAALDPPFQSIAHRCLPATMTSVERLYALYKSVEYVIKSGVAGDIVECGVWRGGSMMCAALSLLHFSDTSRRLYLYDTFEGMPPPKAVDVDVHNRPAAALLSEMNRDEQNHIWALAPLDVVRNNLASTGYPESGVTYVPGPVEETIPATIPDSIALLRLDTDWYSSTRWELDHLFPRLVTGGVLIIDDYGHWQGARRAVDEYFATSRCKMLLNRVDYTGRVGVKCG